MKKREIDADAKKRVLDIVKILDEVYDGAKCSLDFRTPYELIVATILSAQCTDERVNKVTPALFVKYPDFPALARARLTDVEKAIQSTGFYKNKAKSLVECAKSVVADHAGQVPQTIEELVKLRGVGRKTANVVLGNAFDKPAGVVVDTHVGRLSRRLGFTKETDPEKVEIRLNELVPKKHWVMFSHWLIYHGRARCMARGPDCLGCELAHLCPKIGVDFKPKPKSISHRSLNV